MWILHTSDLCITDGDTDGPRRLDDLATWVRNEARVPIDFVVISGNITAHGRSECFANAYEQLEAFCRKTVVQDGAQGLPRLAVAPGPNDCPLDAEQQIDTSQYDAFVKRLYPAEVAEGLEVSSRGVTSRELKAITFFSVPYWGGSGSGLPSDCAAIDALIDDLEKIRVPEEVYARHTPTLLISSQFPVVGRGPDHHRRLERLRAVCGDWKLEIELHLFGSGATTALLPDAFGPWYVALGTGLKDERSPFPVRANLIEIKVRREKNGGARRDDERVEDVYMTNRVYRQPSRGEPSPVGRHISKGELDLFFRPAPSGNVRNYGAFLTQLVETEGHSIVVYGLPGVGKREFMKQATQARTWGTTPVDVLRLEVRSYKDKNFLEALRAPFRQKAKKAQRKKRQPVFVLIRETWVLPDPADQLKARQDFLTGPDVQSLPGHVRIVILCHFSDVETRNGTEAIPLPRLSFQEMEALVTPYSSRLPINVEGGVLNEVASLTGGHAGFAKLILDNAQQAFGEMSPSARVTAQTPRKLLDHALVGDALRKTSRWHIERIKSIFGASVVCEHIQTQVATQMDRRTTGHIPPILVSVDGATAVIGNSPARKEDIRGVFNHLVNLGVIKPHDGSLDVYELTLIAPFLSDLSGSPPEAPEGVNASPPFDDAVVGPARHAPQDPDPMNEEFPPTADIVFLTPLPEEREALLARLPGWKSADARLGNVAPYVRAWLPFTLPSGRAGRYSVAVGVTGKGTSRAATEAQRAIDRWHPRYVIVVGIAGAAPETEVCIGDVVIAETVMESSLQWKMPGGDKIDWHAYATDPALVAAARLFKLNREAIDPPCAPNEEPPARHVGTVVSGDDVIASEVIAAAYKEQFANLIGFEMEAAGAARACLEHALHPRFFMVRAVSDMADSEKYAKGVEARRPYACGVAAAFAVGLLRTGPIPLAAEPKAGDARPSRGPTSGPAILNADNVEHEQKIALAGLIAKSHHVINHSARRALCLAIGVNPSLPFVEVPGSGEAFGLELIEHSLLPPGKSFNALVSKLRALFPNVPPFAS